MLPVACEECFVGEQHDAIAQVVVEVADQVLRVEDVCAVLSPAFAEMDAENAFAAAFFPRKTTATSAGLAGSWNIRAVVLMRKSK